MARKKVVLTRERYVVIGKAHGSEDVSKEASQASARWQRDVAALAEYGHGVEPQKEFEDLRSVHEQLRTSRPEAAAAKRLAIAGRDEAVAQGWAWVDKVESTLTLLSRRNQIVAEKFNAAAPTDDDNLGAGIGALAKLCEEVKADLPSDAKVEQRLQEADALTKMLSTMPGTVSTAKSTKVADTEEIDYVDGQLYIIIRDLNEAGRKAIRNGNLDAAMTDYRFHLLNRSGKPRAKKGETDPTAKPVVKPSKKRRAKSAAKPAAKPAKGPTKIEPQ